MSLFENLYKGTQTTQDGRVSGRGLGAFFLNPFVDEDKLNQSAQQTLNTNTAISLGENIQDLNLPENASALDVQGAAVTKGRERVEEGKKADHGRQLSTLTESLKPQMAQITASVEAQKAQTGLLREQLLQQAREANLTRAENAEIRADGLALERMRMEREDQRYNERMEQLDRKDRRSATQSLVAGLAALGAAFAL